MPSCISSYSRPGYILYIPTNTPSGMSFIAVACDSTASFSGTPSGSVTCNNGLWTDNLSGCIFSLSSKHVERWVVVNGA